MIFLENYRSFKRSIRNFSDFVYSDRGSIDFTVWLITVTDGIGMQWTIAGTRRKWHSLL